MPNAYSVRRVLRPKGRDKEADRRLRVQHGKAAVADDVRADLPPHVAARDAQVHLAVERPPGGWERGPLLHGREVVIDNLLAVHQVARVVGEPAHAAAVLGAAVAGEGDGGNGRV